MTESFMNLVGPIVAFIASLIATGVSIYNARFARYAKQQWWERKVDAYTRIIDALSGLVYYYELHYEAAIEHRDISESLEEETSEHWRRGYTEVRRAAAAGAFLISAEAEDALTTFWREKDEGIEHPDNWFEVLDSHYAAARKCIQAVVAAAKKDLKV